MRGGTVQINWHETKPVLTLDFHPRTGILATGGNDHDIKVIFMLLILITVYYFGFRLQLGEIFALVSENTFPRRKVDFMTF